MRLTLQPWPSLLLLEHAFLKLVRKCGVWQPWHVLVIFLAVCPILTDAACIPSTGCDTAYAFYHVQVGENLTFIAQKFETAEASILAANPSIVQKNFINVGSPLYIPFKCDCINDQLQHLFQHVVAGYDSPYSIALYTFENLTTESDIGTANNLRDVDYVLTGAALDIPVKCFCGDPAVTRDYNLFLTYPVVEGTGGNLDLLAAEFNTSADLVRRFNPGVVWELNQPTQQAFIPLPDPNGSSFKSDAGKSSNVGLIAGAAIGALFVFAVVAFLLYCFCVHRPRKRQKLAELMMSKRSGNQSLSRPSDLQPRFVSLSTGIGTGLTASVDYSIDRSVEFTYEELARATDGFSEAKKIGQGGFAVVFYGEIQGQKLAIKRMNLQATKEFLAELQVLTHVHHTNLVQLIGYCTTDYLFLIYEFMENGTLDHHLRALIGSQAPLSWPSRVQIALDAARGLEYLHEHTRPSYIHRDIKSANILLDKDAHAKVADFGLTKLTETKVDGNLATMSTRVVGTWGYMSPEYATFGEVSPSVDVFAFGVVLLEILSAKEAVLSSGSVAVENQIRSLIKLFHPVLQAPDGRDKLPELMDPALGDNYPLEAAWKMAQLAGACTDDRPEKRPTMRNAVVTLMGMSAATTREWQPTRDTRSPG